MKEIDLVLHDWQNLPPAEREQALTDIRDAAASFEQVTESSTGPRSTNAARRARALNIVASYFHFFNQGQRCQR